MITAATSAAIAITTREMGLALITTFNANWATAHAFVAIATAFWTAAAAMVRAVLRAVAAAFRVHATADVVAADAALSVAVTAVRAPDATRLNALRALPPMVPSLPLN